MIPTIGDAVGELSSSIISPARVPLQLPSPQSPAMMTTRTKMTIKTLAVATNQFRRNREIVTRSAAAMEAVAC